MSDDRNDGLHPRHPGRGKCSLIRMDSDEVEEGGFSIFLPSGDTKVCRWRTTKPITPTLEAAKDYTAKVAQAILEQRGVGHIDIQGVHWTSVTAAVQRIIMDFNDRLQKAINRKMSIEFATPQERRWLS